MASPDHVAHSVTSLRFKRFERPALDWTEGGGQNQLGTWEMEEYAGARASKLKYNSLLVTSPLH